MSAENINLEKLNSKPNLATSEEALSDIEICILEQIMFGVKNTKSLESACGVSQFIVNAAVKKLIEKGYIDLDMNPTKKAYERLRWVDSTRPIEYYIDTKKVLRIALEIGISVTLILLVISIISYIYQMI